MLLDIGRMYVRSKMAYDGHEGGQVYPKNVEATNLNHKSSTLNWKLGHVEAITSW